MTTVPVSRRRRDWFWIIRTLMRYGVSMGEVARACGRDVGMALHHETGGEGFHLWDAWSSGGDKYPGTEVLQRRWDSFGHRGGRQKTAATLVSTS